MRDENGELNNLNHCSDSSGRPDILKDLNIVQPTAPALDDVFNDDDVKKSNINPDTFTQLDDLYTPKKPYVTYDTKAPGVLVEIQDIKEKERKRRRIRQIKKTVGILGWVFCAPLMVMGLCIRDKPDINEDDEWKDDLCMPCYYDINFRYAGDR